MTMLKSLDRLPTSRWKVALTTISLGEPVMLANLACISERRYSISSGYTDFQASR